jgi:hypothetical protein
MKLLDHVLATFCIFGTGKELVTNSQPIFFLHIMNQLNSGSSTPRVLKLFYISLLTDKLSKVFPFAIPRNEMLKRCASRDI